MEHTRLERVRAKIIEAVPEIADRPSQFTVVAKDRGPRITLADVLRAIGSNHESDNVRLFLDIGEVEFDDPLRKISCKWNLALPLDEQEPEVIEFISKVLGV